MKSVDILIGLAVVMLVVSMAVTLVTQFFLTLTASRGRHLWKGLADLLEQLHPGATRQEAEALAKLVLTSPTVQSAGVGPWKLGDVIHREELTKLLLDFAAGNIKQDLTKLEASALAKLTREMGNAGITNPQQTLDNTRMMALQLEKASPELAANVRHSMALLQEASSQYLAKINLWFDHTMDRVSDRFTGDARFWTFISAVLVAVALQLDTVTLVNKLSMDDQLRASFVKVAMDSRGEAKPAETPQTSDEALRNKYFAFLADQGVVSAPTSPGDWERQWQHTNVWGVVISALLLSLGAPFWYSMLGKLLQLRSLLAQKDDAQRTARQTTQTVAEGGGTSVMTPAVASERGDLNAIG